MRIHREIQNVKAPSPGDYTVSAQSQIYKPRSHSRCLSSPLTIVVLSVRRSRHQKDLKLPIISLFKLALVVIVAIEVI